jgi:hypothetical protein
MGPIVKVRLALFILCLDQPGFILCWVAHARALPWFRVVLMNTYQSGFINVVIQVMQEHLMLVNRNMERPPRKIVQPQDIWLCLGLIRELGVRYALPDKGWGLTVDGVWTCSCEVWAWLRHGTRQGALYVALIR